MVSAAARARAPCGLWAASISTVATSRPAATRSSRPGERTAAKAARTASGSSGAFGPAPVRVSAAASARAAFDAWCSPCSARKISSYVPDRPCSAMRWPPTAISRSRTPNSAPSRATCAPTSAHRSISTWATALSCAASTATAPGLMIPDFSRAMPSTSRAQVLGVVHPDGRDHRDRPVDDVRGVPAPAQPDLDDAGLDRSVRERGEAHRREHLELAQRRVVAGVHEVHERRDVAVHLDVALRRHRPVVDVDPLGGALQVRAGVAAGAQTDLGEQGVDHPCRGRLAVRAGEVHHGVAALRVAEQLDEVGDPLQRGRDPRLGPALVQHGLDGEELREPRDRRRRRHDVRRLPAADGVEDVPQHRLLRRVLGDRAQGIAPRPSPVGEVVVGRRS